MSLPRPLRSLVGHEPELSAVRAAFAATDDNAGAVAAVCAHLGGLLLAIELAAAHLRALTSAAGIASSRTTIPSVAGARLASTPVATRLGESEV